MAATFGAFDHEIMKSRKLELDTDNVVPETWQSMFFGRDHAAVPSILEAIWASITSQKKNRHREEFSPNQNFQNVPKMLQNPEKV
eukprot:2327088-Amphidinium_carterae.1